MCRQRNSFHFKSNVTIVSLITCHGDRKVIPYLWPGIIKIEIQTINASYKVRFEHEVNMHKVSGTKLVVYVVLLYYP